MLEIRHAHEALAVHRQWSRARTCVAHHACVHGLRLRQAKLRVRAHAHLHLQLHHLRHLERQGVGIRHGEHVERLVLGAR